MLNRASGRNFYITHSGRLDISLQISYRFRIVSISCDPAFTFSIDGHQFYVIEVEGTNVQPLLVDSLQIFVGTQISKPLFPLY